MVQPLQYWCELYERHKQTALCLDIEVTRFNGPISIVGLYKPKDGLIECQQFVKGRDLNQRNLTKAFVGCTLLITFNGRKFDVPRIKREFPGAIPHVPIIDLYLIASRLNLKTNLKVLENTFGIDRLDPRTKRRGIAVRLWKRYITYKDEKALALLLEYNKQDTVNLYPLAEELMKRNVGGRNSRNGAQAGVYISHSFS
jgi:uncharacterized protein YprB with RNaseH-like and TPR domain